MRQARVESIGIDEYLEAERTASERHEYVAGRIFAMVGASRRHNRICLNLATLLQQNLSEHPSCRVYMSDVKLRVEAADAFYYPDLMVGCDPNDRESYFLCAPQVIVEVLSASTEAIDRREKWIAYQTLSSLREYILIAQDQPRAQMYLRNNLESHWWQQDHGPEDNMELPSLGIAIALRSLYKNID
jgi:Uma2 family endonuclease